MNKYKDALDTFCMSTAVVKDENGMITEISYNPILAKETSILEEAIEKAEKYDIYLRNKRISIFDKLNDTRKTIESVEQERDDLSKRCDELEQKCVEYKNQLNDSVAIEQRQSKYETELKIENVNLQNQVEELKELIKALRYYITIDDNGYITIDYVSPNDKVNGEKVYPKIIELVNIALGFERYNKEK